jgi:gliding motility-associated-like protein
MKIGIYTFLVSVCLLATNIQVVGQPTIVTQPSDSSICTGHEAAFSIIAVNAETYQWQENDGGGWYILNESSPYASGTTSTTLLISDATTALNAYQYRCYAFDNIGGSDVSDIAHLYVNDEAALYLQPIGQDVCKGDTAIFQIMAENVSNYQWQENNGTGWRDLSDDSFYSGVNTAVLSAFTVVGMNGYDYRCHIFNQACRITSDEANLTVRPLPAPFSITGGGIICAGGEGIAIGLNNSEININYSLLLNGNPIQVLAGNGSALDFGLQNTEGIYSINAIHNITGCSNVMDGETEITIVELPIIFALSGQGGYCEGNNGADICLSSSEINTTYELYKNNSPSGIFQIGNGSGICFEGITETGNYSVVATRDESLCQNTMEGEMEVFIHPKPKAIAGQDQNILFGTTTVLTGEGQDGSGNYNYFWSPESLLEDNLISNPQTYPITSTTYFKFQTIDQETGCISLADTLIIEVSDGPLSLLVSALPQNICLGAESQLNAIAGGGTGIYSYLWSSQPFGFTSEIYNPIVSPEVNTTYYIEASDGINTKIDSISIIVTTTLGIFNVTGGGNICGNNDGVEIGLDSSEENVFYELILNDTDIESVRPGNGSAISFGLFNQEGIYTVNALSLLGGCTIKMNGNAEVQYLERPEVLAGPDQQIDKGTNTQLQSLAIGGSGNYSFLWQPEDKLENATIANPNTQALTNSSLFTVRVQDNNSGCFSKSDTTVVIARGGSLSVDVLAENSSICTGEMAHLLCLPSGGTGDYTYSWSSSPEGFHAQIKNPIATPEEDTYYIAQINDGVSTAIDSILISVNQTLEKFDISSSGSLCQDEGIEILLSGSTQSVVYELYRDNIPTAYVRIGTGSIISFGPIYQSGIYQIAAHFISGNCFTFMDGQAIIYPANLPKIFNVGGNPTICQGSIPAILELNGTENEVVYTLYKNGISTGRNIEGNGLPIVFDNITQEGDYTVIAQNPYSACEMQMNGSLVTKAYESPNINFTNDTTICQGDSITLKIISGSYIVWSTTPPSTAEEIIVSPYESTIYPVLVANENGCTCVKEIEVNVNTLPDVLAAISGNLITVNPEGYTEYSFINEGNILQQSASNEYLVPAFFKKNDKILILVVDEFGCETLTEIVLEIDQNTNAFTPNGDGINDLYLKGNDIIVIDRWGQELFNGTEGWDGNYNGTPMAPGTYYFLHFMKDPMGNVIKTVKGSLTLIRE